MEAELLRAMLAGDSPASARGFARAYQHRVAALTRRPWVMSTVQDRGWHLGPAAARSTRFTGAVLGTVQQTMAAEPEVFRRFLAAMHMTRSSAVLLHPGAVLALASTALRRGVPADDAHLWWGHTPHDPDRTA